MTITVTGLYTYPIKSCGGLSHDAFYIEATGPAFDRHWVITDNEGMFYTQRDYPQMALIQPRFEGDCLVLSAPGMSDVRVSLDIPPYNRRAMVEIWHDTVEGADEGDMIAEWLSEYLGTDARLFTMPNTTRRELDPTYSKQPAQVGFADAFPLLLVSEESLDDLNTRMKANDKAPVPMSRFRPNVVVRGAGPFAEDHWEHFTIGNIPFDGVKPCARCAMTTVDPTTGDVPDPKEPLATLATFRKGPDNKVLFGQNIIHRDQGEIALGDTLRIIKAKNSSD